ncbi:MAG TPA: phosphoribosylaminoimidazolesuccinocarboxamide synthase, partial [Chloroflexota bacterium]
VRDIYDLGDHLLLVASDRISAFDVVLDQPIPGKGLVLTALSEFWFETTRHIVPNHLVATDLDALPAALRPFHDRLYGRSMLVRKARRIDIECVVRGYLAGSAWSEYRKTGRVAGEPMPAGLRESDHLPEPIFTPATKAASGHDENITVAEMRRLVGDALTDQLREISLALYRFAEAYARERGIIIADTKFEFGLLDGQIILIDEVLTPDSSRFWPVSEYEPGRSQPSFDKQYVRDYLSSTGWNHEPPPPPLPIEVVQRTSEKYREAYRRLVTERAGQ